MQNRNLSGRQFDTLKEVESAGYVTDEWNRWQQGECGTYACAALQERPDLRLGSLGHDAPGAHFAVHDDQFAYDSAGKHPLPYRGVSGDMNWYPDQGGPDHWGLPYDEQGDNADDALAAARSHIKRHNIFER